MDIAYKLNNEEEISLLLDALNGDLSNLEELESDDEVIHDTPETRPARIGADVVPRDDDMNDNAVAEVEDELETPVDITSDVSDVQITNRKDIEWRKRLFIPPNIENFIVNKENHFNSDYPIDYFSNYITEECIKEIVEKTNMYALQNGHTFPPTHYQEIRAFIGLHIYMSVLKFPRVEMYWRNSLQVLIFVETMSRNRFYQLRSNIHIVDNFKKKDTNDKFYKVRPMFDFIKSRCNQLEIESCVEEQMIPFKGQHSTKQYVKGKPQPWGIKNFVLCGKSGLVYDFLLYQGSTTELDQNNLKLLGLGASVVLHLTKILKKENHLLYYDNFFSTYNLLEILKKNNIFAAGTVRINRFGRPNFLSDKECSKKGRGFYEEMVSRDGQIALCKWTDNRSVVLASNFVSVGTPDKVKRWDKTSKKEIEISRPEIVQKYNHGMGGVDKLDQLIALYRIFLKSRKWTLRMLFHAVDIACVNSWLEYKIEMKKLKEPYIDLLEFKLRLGESLVKMGSQTGSSKKRGRPRAVEEEPRQMTNRKKVEVRPIIEVQRDLVDHMPNYDLKKEATRCKNVGCTKRTHVYCTKCNVHLCFVKERNCFMQFHH